MMKPFLSAFLIVTIIVGFALAGTLQLGTVQAAGISGIITSDTTWTKANSPYSLTGPARVNNGVTLTIEAGTTVNLNDYYIQVEGTLKAKGTDNNQIFINDGRLNSPYGITFTAISSSWNTQTGSGSIIENAILNGTTISMDSAAPKINNNYIGGNILYAQGAPIISNNYISGLISDRSKGGSALIVNNNISGYIVAAGEGSPVISQNHLIGNPGTDWVGRPIYRERAIYIDGTNAYISDNFISGTYTVAGISIMTGRPIIERNSIDVQGTGIDVDRAGPLILNNTISGTIGIKLSISLSDAISYNNIQGTQNSIYLTSDAANDVNATLNWWGTTDTQAIDQKIHDNKNDFNLGKVNYTPFLSEPNPQAMPDPNAPIPVLNTSPSPSTSPSSPSPSESSSPTPYQESPQPELFGAILGAVIIAVVLGVGLGLLVYLIKRK